jgi:uncharacterized protein YdiU (UPF0061 family)
VTLADLEFDNRFTAALPADPSDLNRPRQVHAAAYTRIRPTPVSRPRTIAVSDEMLELIGLDRADAASPEFAAVFSGNTVLDTMDPFAMNYAGHQFGNWAGQLGDGRAIGLGEAVAVDGSHQMLQLKGAGPTPYSRSADGRAVLRSSVREFLCSEAMHHLGVPTTRALSLVLTGDQVVRDMLYDGRPAPEPGAVVCRVAPSFTRFGNFELFASRDDLDTLRTLADFTLRTHFGDLGPPGPEAYAAMFAEVSRRTALMIVDWMRVGFVHGVMNTDNMSILGLTIDYGPYGWLEDYDPNWTPNTTDAGTGRYRYGQQPQVAQWNLVRLAEALYPLVEDTEPLQAAIEDYATTFNRTWQSTVAAKLGLERFRAETDEALMADLFAVLQLAETDMTIFHRRLADVAISADGTAPTPAGDGHPAAVPAPLLDAYYRPEQLTAEVTADITAWIDRYRRRVLDDRTPDHLRRQRMNAVNPKYVLRNYMAQMAIDGATPAAGGDGDPTLIHELLELLRHPYDEQPAREQWAAKRPDWARDRVGCSQLSCSS